MTQRPIKRALIGVSNKNGLLELATGLHGAGVEIVSTGGTAKVIADAGVPVTPVEKITGFPESLDGRVKTLHPRVHAGLLADTRKQEHLDQLKQLDIQTFDLLVVNLYPFEQTVSSGAPVDECVEQIDIGGPAMVRAAAKNHPSVGVVVDPSLYPWVLERVQAGGFTVDERKALAAQAFAHTASYDVAVANWFATNYVGSNDGWPAFAGQTWGKSKVLRYGENPHQQAALYGAQSGGLAGAKQLHGKEMSYNNYVDADAAMRAAYDHEQPAVAVIKHANPCGIAIGVDIADAHRKAHATDPLSAYGGVIAANQPVSKLMAEQVAAVFTEVIVAPSYADGAVEILQRKKNIRILEATPQFAPAELKPISGGALVQMRDAIDADGDDPSNWKLACGKPVDDATLADLAFAWRSVRAVKSNAILLASGGAAVGVGMGQVNRVDSAKLAVTRAGDRVVGSVAASDAFFPAADGFEALANAGVRAVVQPGGSKYDPDVIAAAKAAGIPMYFTGTRHFFH